jgi:hypothetical protein
MLIDKYLCVGGAAGAVLTESTKSKKICLEANPSETAREIYQYIQRLIAGDLMSCWPAV